ncbi:MAG: patatin-like phospholipase family protein [Vicinamibacterales bacterium]
MSDYSPRRRTALVLSGTGAHGAYHAGVLKAFHESGVKIDVVAGRGVGAAAAALAAIDGAGGLWAPTGPWLRETDRPAYRWRLPLRIAGWLTVLLAGVVAFPVLLLLVAVVVYPVGFLLEMLGSGAGGALVGAYSAWLTSAFAGPHLPTYVPRAAMIVGAAIVLALGVGTAVARAGAPARREVRGGWWWALAAVPLDAADIRRAFVDTLWGLIRGAAAAERPDARTIGKRYGEVLAESLGQPGVCELMLVVSDVDARHDVVAAFLKDPHRAPFFAARPGIERQAETVDLATPAGELLPELLAAALTPAVGVEPHLVRFPPTSYWRGEVRRLCDRSGSIVRLLDELAAAGVEQVIVVGGPSSTPRPHALPTAGLGLTDRIGDALALDEASGLRDAVTTAKSRFSGVYLVSPEHSAIGPFDVNGAYDRSSDRQETIAELLTRGYEDAHAHFIAPVLGASGEYLRVRQDEELGATYGEGVFDTADPRG